MVKSCSISRRNASLLIEMLHEMLSSKHFSWKCFILNSSRN
jgi:hypothetical protein